MDLIVARKNGKNELKKCYYIIHRGDADERQRSLKSLQFPSRASFINKIKKNIRTVFSFFYFEKRQGEILITKLH